MNEISANGPGEQGAAAQPAAPGKTNGQESPHRAAPPPSSETRVVDLKMGGRDARGVQITRIFASSAGEYAIYKAEDRMMVHFADDSARAEKQRRDVAALSGQRSKLELLLNQMSRTEYYDGQAAHAFQLALDGCAEEAKAIMGEAVANAEKERACAGRLQYLICGVAASIAFLVPLGLLAWVFPFPTIGDNLWIAAIGGTVGALFSIAISIRSRKVALDLYRAANISDGVLRIMIGVIAAGVLLLLLSTGVLPELKFNDASLKPTNWQLVLVIGFVAGFFERLLPDLLDEEERSSGAAKPAGAGS